MASVLDQIREIIDAHPEMHSNDLCAAVKEICKEKKSRTNHVQKAMQEFVAKHKNVSLTRLRRELKLAYASMHSDDDAIPAAPMTAYRAFVKEQSAILRDSIDNQRERMIEIGKRWKAYKSDTTATAEEDDASTAVATKKRSHTTGPPVTRRVTRSSTLL